MESDSKNKTKDPLLLEHKLYVSEDIEFTTQSFGRREFGLENINNNNNKGYGIGIDGVSAIFDIGNRLGQAGVEFGTSVNGVIQQFFRRLPVPFRHDESDVGGSLRADFDTQRREAVLAGHKEDLKSLAEQFRDYCFSETSEVVSEEFAEEDGVGGFNLKSTGYVIKLASFEFMGYVIKLARMMEEEIDKRLEETHISSYPVEGKDACKRAKMIIAEDVQELNGRVLGIITDKGTTQFEEIVQQIKGMGFDPSKTTFLVAIKALIVMTKSTWETKVDAYKIWGWTEGEIQNAFKKHPQCMRQSEKKIMLTMDYLVNQMGYNSSLIAEYPLILSFLGEKDYSEVCWYAVSSLQGTD